MVTYTMTNLAGEKSSATIGTAADVALTITADPRTNTLLVGGTDQHVRLASRVIEQLDSYPAQERICRIYRLRNVQATEIETAMKKWLDEEHKRLTESMGTDNLGAVQRLLEREVSVVAVTTSNDVSGSTSQPSNRPSYNYGTGSSGTGPSAQLQSSGQSSNVLLVSASSRYFDNVMEMIQELDEPPPQVLIDVLMAEVTLDDQMDLGAGWQYQNTFHANTFSGVSGTNINGVGSTTVGGGATPTNVPNPAAISSVDNGFNLSVTGGNLQFFLRALESQGRMRVLNRPQILAIDNQVARIQSGQQVPIPEINYYYGTANPTTSYNYRDVGIILEVVPRISPDGFVRMDVHPGADLQQSFRHDDHHGQGWPFHRRRRADHHLRPIDRVQGAWPGRYSHPRLAVQERHGRQEPHGTVDHPDAADHSHRARGRSGHGSGGPADQNAGRTGVPEPDGDPVQSPGKRPQDAPRRCALGREPQELRYPAAEAGPGPGDPAGPGWRGHRFQTSAGERPEMVEHPAA
jgi:hypothetical protein